jgi:hypothetical protein
VKQVAILAGLLGLSLVATYMTWFEPEEEVAAKGESVAVYPAAVGDVTRLVWTSEKLDVTVEKKTDARGDYTWVQTVERKKKKADPAKKPEAPETPPAEPADPAAPAEPPAADPAATPGGDAPAPAAPEPAEEVEVKEMAFRGNDTAEKMWEQFAPLMALRELIPGPDIDTKVFGFEEPAGTLVVTRHGGEVTLTVGGEAYGSKDRYVQSGSRVFLVDDNTLRPLQYAQMRLLERALQPVAEDAADGVEIATPEGASVQMVRANPDDKGKAFWARAATPQQEDTSTGLWLGKLFRLRASEYVPEPPAGLIHAFTWTVKDEAAVWTIQMHRTDDTEKADWYAQSDYDRAWTKLTRSLAEDVAADLAGVIAGTANVAPGEEAEGEEVAPEAPPHP